MLNKVTLIGNVGADPEAKKVNGKTVVNFTLATSESYKDKNGEKVTLTEWHRLNAWSPLADIIEKYVKKGSQIYIEGKNKTRSYDDNGKRYITEVEVRELRFLGGKKDSNQGGGYQAPTAQEESQDNGGQWNEETDDLPF